MSPGRCARSFFSPSHLLLAWYSLAAEVSGWKVFGDSNSQDGATLPLRLWILTNVVDPCGIPQTQVS